MDNLSPGADEAAILARLLAWSAGTMADYATHTPNKGEWNTVTMETLLSWNATPEVWWITWWEACGREPLMSKQGLSWYLNSLTVNKKNKQIQISDSWAEAKWKGCWIAWNWHHVTLGLRFIPRHAQSKPGHYPLQSGVQLLDVFDVVCVNTHLHCVCVPWAKLGLCL